jgi:hypothetical protein
MTLRRAAQGFPKSLAILPVLALAATGFPAMPSLLGPGAVLCAAFESAQSGPDGEFVTRTGPSKNLPDRRVYAKLSIQVFGAVPLTRNGKTGQV